ncbi:hypothetical protein ACFFRL_13670 [Agromyces hippuratus]
MTGASATRDPVMDASAATGCLPLRVTLRHSRAVRHAGAYRRI